MELKRSKEKGKIEYGEVGLGFNLIRGRAKLSESDTWGRATRSLSGNDVIFRADRVDLKNLDVQLEKHLNRVRSINSEPHLPTEDWELDLSKLDIRCYRARGSFGTVYKGTYDKQDVAGKHYFGFFLCGVTSVILTFLHSSMRTSLVNVLYIFFSL